jgi:hypothetical protein
MSEFETTIPSGEPELMRASSFQHYLEELTRRTPDGAPSTRLSSLSPSLTQDLLRFEQQGRAADVLEVVAACVRHVRSVTVHLHAGDKALPLTLFPHERLLHCAVDLAIRLAMTDMRQAALAVLQVEPAVLRPPGDPDAALVGDPALYRPLPPLLWALAIHGHRAALLTELAGAAVYRVSPTLDLSLLPAAGPLRAAVLRLRREVASLREIASWPGMGRSRATRLLNALYLQAGLIVSRSHPAALGESWFGAGAA